jgi:hypothetical protein
MMYCPTTLNLSWQATALAALLIVAVTAVVIVRLLKRG